MSTFGHTWFLCGGWAVDLWLGHQTRDHGDVDIAIFHHDQRALFDHLAGWHLIAHDADVPGATRDPREPWDGRTLDLPAHIHARPGGARNLEILHQWVPSGRPAPDGMNLEIILAERNSHDWILSNDPRVALPIERSFRPSPLGLPAAVPEVLMFFKATAYWGLHGHPRDYDLNDFRALLPLVTGDRRDWLHDAIARLQPEHPWLAMLSG